MGPTVWDEDGPIPIENRSRALRAMANLREINEAVTFLRVSGWKLGGVHRELMNSM